MPPDSLEVRFNGPVPRALAWGAVVDQATLRRRRGLSRARAMSLLAARARADIAHLRRFQPASPALGPGRERLEWARAEAEFWRRWAAVEITAVLDSDGDPCLS